MNPPLVPNASAPVQLPGKLPHLLDDPLRFYRRLLNFLLVFMFLGVLAGCLLPRLGGQNWGLAIYQAFGALQFVVVVLVWRLLPRRAPAAIYLRSFRNDSRAYPIRTLIARVLGPDFRLAGIRDPRRRWPWLLRQLVYLFFLLRYCRPRFMNLEAGRDWKARLWRTLGTVRCAFIDLTDITPFVLDEVQLALHCLGPERVLFIVDTSLSQSEWENKIASQLDPPVSADSLRVAIWDGAPEGRRLFANQVRHFAERVPEEPVGLKAEAWPLTQSEQPIQGRSGGRELALIEFLLSCVLGYGLVLLLNHLGAATPPSLQLLWFIPALGLLLLSLLFLFQYWQDAGVTRDWVVSSSFLGLAAFGSAVLFVSEARRPPEGLRGIAARTSTENNLGQLGLALRYEDTGLRAAADRTVNANNLKEIGIALSNYEESYSRGPPAIGYSPDGKPLVSWRVLLLPYLDEDALFKEYYLGEPWDSPHNLSLSTRMPRAYRSPYLAADDSGKTPYRVFL